MKMAKEFKISYWLVTVCYLALGLVLLFYPDFSARMLCYTLGGITILYGLAHVVTYFLRSDFEDFYRLDLVTGLVLTGCGIFVMLRPEVVATMLHIIIGLAICLDSLIKLQNSIDLRRLQSRVWWVVLVLAVLTGALGITLLIYAGTGILTLMQFIGICLVFDGCVNLFSFTFLSVNLSRLRKARRLAAEQAEADANAIDVETIPVEEREAVAAAEQAQPDEGVKNSILDALHFLRKKAEPADAPEAEPQAVAAAVVLKPDATGASATPEVAAARESAVQAASAAPAPERSEDPEAHA